jgi:hypothetical protein
MLYLKWAICYIYYKTSEGLVMFWDCLTLENEGARILQDFGNHSSSDAMSLTQRRYVTSQKIWMLRSSTDKTCCSKIQSHWLIPLHYDSNKNNFPSIISEGNFINYYQLQQCTTSDYKWSINTARFTWKHQLWHSNNSQTQNEINYTIQRSFCCILRIKYVLQI